MLRRLIALATRSRSLSSVFFGGTLPHLGPGAHYFDVTTLGLLRNVKGSIPRGSRVLDMGTGSAAVLGLWLWRHRGCRVTCTDVDAEIVRTARESVRMNGAPIEVVHGPLFESVSGDFDHVLFNPPYVATATGRSRGLPEEYRSQWDGGPDGTATIAAFLAAFTREGGSATARLGVNRRHIPRAVFGRILEHHGDLGQAERWSHPWLPVDVYALVRRKSPSASASSPLE